MRRAITPLTPASDPARAIPAASGEREWAIDAALASLDGEERRLLRLGFELPLTRCREQRRFWEFVRAVHALPEDPGPGMRKAG